MPYRSSRHETPKRTAEPGIVNDMVRQFADRYAFLRELVQNGIDAGATRIAVRIERDIESRVVTSVTDDGSGMTRAIIEGPLLTLFSSSKEKATDKIGKYGIGFVSVFALEPEHVEVRTAAASSARERWLVRLFGDHTYELETLPSETPHGTTIVIVQSPSTNVDEHAESSRRALERWCRHARVPIELTISNGYDVKSIQINERLSVPGVVTLSFEDKRKDERFVIGVGLPADQPVEPCFCGYYNRGLTLYETNAMEPHLDGIRFKVDSPRLAHTLSRDNIRRDDELNRVLDVVRARVRKELFAAIESRINEGALRATEGTPDELTRLLNALGVGALVDQRTEATFQVPLVESIGSERTMSIRDLEERSTKGDRQDILFSDQSTPLTKALARELIPVVRHVVLGPYLRPFIPWRADMTKGLADAAHLYGHAIALRPDDAHVSDAKLRTLLVKTLKEAGRGVAAARFAKLTGVSADDPFRVQRELRGSGQDDLPHEAVWLSGSPRIEWSRSSTLFLNCDDPTVRLARRRARTDVAVAAHLLTRFILVSSGPIEPKIVDRLLEAAVE